MKITKLYEIINEKDGKQYSEFYPSETVFTVEGDFEDRDRDKELEYNEIKEFILKNTDKIKSLSVKSKYFKYEDLVLCLIFDSFEYSSGSLSISKLNEEIEIRKGTRIIKFPEILEKKYFPFVEEEEMEIFKIIQLIDNNLIIKKEEKFIEFSYNDNLVLASNNFVVRTTKSEDSNGKFQILGFKFNKYFKPFEIEKKLDIYPYDFSVSNEKIELYVMYQGEEYFSLYSKNDFQDYILQFSLDFPSKNFERFETNPVERFGLNQFNSLRIVINFLENFQCFVSENSKKMLQERIEILKKQIQKENKSFYELKPNEKLENLLNNLKNIF